MLNVALGFRVHSGWACMVAVAAPSHASVAIERRRLELIDRKAGTADQPYHAAKDMTLPDARAFLDQRARAARDFATASLRQNLSYLAANGCKPARACVLLGSGRPTDDLAATLRSHPMIHTAEGHFFRNALLQACESCRVPVITIKEKELFTSAAATLRVSPEELQRRIAALGKSIGPPWRQDEKLCTLAAWLALATGRGRARPA